MTAILPMLGEQLKSARRARSLTQPELASRVGRPQSRISELERDLTTGRLTRDRLSLFAEICDALNLTPVLVPRAQLETVRRALNAAPPQPSRPAPTTFDEVFVDLSDARDEGHG